MPTTINASNTSGGAVVTGDGSGILELQSGGVTALTANGANVTVAGTLTATGGILPAPVITTLNQDVTITATGTIAADTIGFRGLPQNSQTSAYTLALSDQGKQISITTGGIIIPANSSVPFPIGSEITFFNNSSSNQIISITTDTLREAGTASTGPRTLAQYGFATCVKVASTTWVISGAESFSVEYLIVAGGGGGAGYGGGGGAGGFVTGTFLPVVTGTAYTVTVGAGGAGTNGSSAPGNSGSNSKFASVSPSIGGGGGGTTAAGTDPTTKIGKTGGSGGGGGGSAPGGAGGLGTDGQGNAGGSGTGSRGGGGGGAGAVGANSVASAGTGNGGAGLSSSISGSSVFYAGGGGGTTNSGGTSTGGTGGGGNGGYGSNGTSGTANTGGGGGSRNGSVASGSGGSGVVIIRYPDAFANASSTTGSPTLTTTGGYKIYTFNASGTITW
jgi:hypothetical protein